MEKQQEDKWFKNKYVWYTIGTIAVVGFIPAIIGAAVDSEGAKDAVRAKADAEEAAEKAADQTSSLTNIYL